MKIVLIGATGTIGAATHQLLARTHEVMSASRTGQVRVDLADPATIDMALAGTPDAVVCAAAHAPLLPIGEVDEETALDAARAKLFGQLALVARARDRLADGGSITLTAGRFDGPMPGGTIGALVNAGLEAFAAAAAPELPRRIRINVVSPGWVTETAVRAGLTGVPTTPAADVAAAFAESVEGSATGTVFRP